MSGSDPQARRTRRRPWAALVLITVTVVACAAALVFRTPLHSRYWAWRLARTTDPARCGVYVALLCNAGDAGRWGIRAVLTDRNPSVRQYGVIILQHINSRWAHVQLLERMSDPDPDIRRLASVGLAMRGDETIIPTLVWQYQTGDADDAATATFALEYLATPDAITALHELTVQPADPAHHAALVDALSGIGTPECVPALLELLADNRECDVPSRMEVPPARLTNHLRGSGYDVVAAPAPVLASIPASSSAPSSAPTTAARPRTIAERAAAVLARITGVQPPFSSAASEEDRATAQRQWRDWWIQRNAER